MATPLLSVALPSTVSPSLNVTVPVGVFSPGVTALTVAVKVTDWPRTALAQRRSAIVVWVAAGVTVCVKLSPVLPWKLPSPS